MSCVRVGIIAGECHNLVHHQPKDAAVRAVNALVSLCLLFYSFFFVQLFHDGSCPVEWSELWSHIAPHSQPRFFDLLFARKLEKEMTGIVSSLLRPAVSHSLRPAG